MGLFGRFLVFFGSLLEFVYVSLLSFLGVYWWFYVFFGGIYFFEVTFLGGAILVMTIFKNLSIESMFRTWHSQGSSANFKIRWIIYGVKTGVYGVFWVLFS